MAPEPHSTLHPQAYQIRLPAFQGPVDLLLRLIEERQLAITAVSLAAVADQYLEHIRSLDEQDGAELAAFIEVAARLLLIKSRQLLPAAPTDDEDQEEDIALDLVRRLEEYRRYRLAADWLTERRAQGLALYSREPTLPDEPTPVPRPSSAELLLAALRRTLETEETLAEHADDVVSPVAISLPRKLRMVLKQLWRHGAVRFHELIAGARSRAEVVVTFLAVLELVRRGRAVATQQAPFADIEITRTTIESATGRPVEAVEQVC